MLKLALSQIGSQIIMYLYFQVRRETRLSYKLATHAVYVVLENLAVLTPSPLTSLIDGILKEFEVPLDVSNSLLDSTEDMTRLISISDNLDSVKNDAQQRSWELFDDQASIMECLNELKSILVMKHFTHL